MNILLFSAPPNHQYGKWSKHCWSILIICIYGRYLDAQTIAQLFFFKCCASLFLNATFWHGNMTCWLKSNVEGCCRWQHLLGQVHKHFISLWLWSKIHIAVMVGTLVVTVWFLIRNEQQNISTKGLQRTTPDGSGDIMYYFQFFSIIHDSLRGVTYQSGTSVDCSFKCCHNPSLRGKEV